MSEEVGEEISRGVNVNFLRFGARVNRVGQGLILPSCSPLLFWKVPPDFETKQHHQIVLILEERRDLAQMFSLVQNSVKVKATFNLAANWQSSVKFN